jgi:YVTN family beta-propeller protein
MSVVAVAEAQPVATCTNTVTKTSPTFGVLPICGAPLAAVVIDAAGHAFASNPARNEVDVVNVYTGALETTIPVGSEPKGLDLSPDGATLYVADSGASQVSVVDVATRRETGRINIPPPQLTSNDSAFSIAIANNGKAFLATTFNGFGMGGRMLEITLSTGAVRLRSDFAPRGITFVDTELTPSGDHSHIGVIEAGTSDGPVWVYDAATDSFGQPRDLGWYYYDLALDRAGSRLLAGNAAYLTGDAYLIDSGVVKGEIPGGGRGMAIAPSGTTAYQVRDTDVAVLDLARFRVAATIALPENRGTAPGLAALSPDGTTLAVLTATGISLVSVANTQPVATCTNVVTPASPNFGVLPLCGAPLASVIIDATNHAFASNPARNEVDVVNMRTGALETTIPVGSQPSGLDLSPDGATLYVADRGGDQVSVVDVATRRETRRINIPPHPDDGFDTPYSIAVADNGKALVSTTFAGSGFFGRILEIDLSTGAVRARPDFNNGGYTTESTILAPSGDHSHIGIAFGDDSTGPVFMYTAATDSFSPEHDFGFLNELALNHSGNRVVVGPGYPGTLVLDGNLAPVGTFDTHGWAITVAADGTAYRLQPDQVEVIDLTRRVILRTIPLPDQAIGLPGAVAVSPDGTSLGVLTTRGMSLISTVAPVPATFSYPSDEQTTVESTKPFTWNTVAAAEGYVLVVGTTLHSHDLVNSGILPPSQSAFAVPDLPAGKTLYATLMTKVDGTWTVFHDITFTAVLGHANFGNPLDAQTGVDTTKPFTWHQLGAAQNYVLVVGTTRHGHDLVNSGILPFSQSAFNVPDLPAGKTLYATLLTEVNGTWTRFQDITFSAAIGHATFTNPVNGQTIANNARTVTWSTIPGAQGYIVALGSSTYGTDLANSGILPASKSSYTIPILPKGKVVHATLLTKVNGAFTRFQAITFTVNAS